MHIRTPSKPSIFKLTIALILALMSLTVQQSLAQTKVVVIPMAGDDLKPLKNIVSVAKANGDFSDPVAALASINNASASNSYLIVIAPGEYTLSERMIMKEWVSVSGSGEATTRLVSGYTTDDPSVGLVELANNSTLSYLTVENLGGGLFSGAILSIADDATARLENVTLLASGGSEASAGILLVNNSSMTIRNVSSTATGPAKNYGVRSQDSSAQYYNVLLIATGGSITNRAIYNSGASSPKMIEIDARGTGVNGWGIYNDTDAEPIIRRSTIAGQAGSIFGSASTTTKVSQSTVIGVPGGAGTQICVASDDGNGNAKNSDCS